MLYDDDDDDDNGQLVSSFHIAVELIIVDDYEDNIYLIVSHSQKWDFQC